MAEELFEVYIRDQDGRTYHTDIRKGLEQFLSEEGYRITFNIEGCAITLRRGTDATDSTTDSLLDQESVNCTATIRGLRIEEPVES